MTERVLTIDEVEDAYNAASMYAVKEWHGYQDGNWNVKADFAAALCKLAIQALRSEKAESSIPARLIEYAKKDGVLSIHGLQAVLIDAAIALNAKSPSSLALTISGSMALAAEIEAELNQPTAGAEGVWYCVADDKPCPTAEGCSAGQCGKYGQPAVEKVRRLARLAHRAAEVLKSAATPAATAKPHAREYAGKIEDAPPAIACSEIEQGRAAQAAAVMPLIGNLLDQWDGVPNDLKKYEGLESVRRVIGQINKAMESAPTPPTSARNEWREAVIDALVVNFIYAKEHDDNPRKALNDLLAWEQTVALDPKVSSAAQALIDQGRALASSAIARIQFEDVVQWARYATNVTPTDARVADAILKALGEAPDTKHSPTVFLVRQAIFHVLDGREWNFEDDEQRVDFADQVASWLPNV